VFIYTVQKPTEDSDVHERPQEIAMTLTTGQIHVGERLRQLRTQRGLSVRTLAAKAGFSPSFISQVEHDQVSPSIASLQRIAAVLGVTLGGFFTESTFSPVTVVRAADRQELVSSWSQAIIEALGPAGGMRVLEPIMISLAPGGRSGTRLHAVLGEQFALVCDGEVMLTLSDTTYALRPGDAVSIAAETPHQWKNPAAESARVLIVSARVGLSDDRAAPQEPSGP
jgi:transcriptional regulator with XRE-family HTH domain